MNELIPQLHPQQVESVSMADEVDLRGYWAIVWREKWGIFGLGVAVCLLTTVVIFNMMPTYSSTATLLIEAKEANVVSIEEVYGIDATQREYFATQFEILNSRQLAEDVIRKLELDKHPAFDPAQKKPFVEWQRWIPFLPEKKPLSQAQVWQSVVNQFQNALGIEPVRNTQLVRISFESPYPELTYRITNALGEAYIDGHLEARLSLTQKAATWLTERLSSMREDLEAAERALQSFREKENLVDVSGVQTLTAKELDEITQGLVAARNRTSEARSQFQAIGNIAAGYDQRWETLSAVLNDQLSRNLKQQEAQASRILSELSQRYGPKHPKWIAAQLSLDDAREAYRDQVLKVVSGFEEIYEQARADEISLEASLNRSKQQIQDINRKTYQLSQLEREVQTSQQLYDLFFTRFKETNATTFEAANARFVDRAVRPFAPVKPRKGLILILAALLSGVAGVMLAFLKDMLDNTIKVAAEVEAKLGQPVVGVLPLIKLKKNEDVSISEAVLSAGQHGFSEAVRTTRTSIALSGIDKPMKRLVFTSSVPGEGKTTLTINIALGFGQMEKVVLVDADMRRPSVAENCGLKHRTPGLSNIIAGTESLDECVYPYLGIDVIPAGTVPPNPLELLSSHRFQDLLGSLSEKYERILVDTAPTQAVSDSMVISALADGVVYVVKSDSTTTQIAKDGIERLLRVNAHLLGVVLNQFDAENASRYGHYYKGYYDYYGYGSKKPYS